MANPFASMKVRAGKIGGLLLHGGAGSTEEEDAAKRKSSAAVHASMKVKPSAAGGGFSMAGTAASPRRTSILHSRLGAKGSSAQEAGQPLSADKAGGGLLESGLVGIKDFSRSMRVRASSTVEWARSKEAATKHGSIDEGKGGEADEAPRVLQGLFGGGRGSGKQRGSGKRQSSEEGLIEAGKMSLAELTQLDLERREKLRDKGTEDSPYLHDAQVLLEEPLNTANELELQASLNKIQFWCWLGGKPVQDLFANSSVMEQISDLLQGRMSDPTYVYEPAPEEPNTRPGAHNRKNSSAFLLGGSAANIAVPVLPPLDGDLRVDADSAIAALGTFEAICRDHPKNLRMAFTSGRIMELLEFVVVPGLSKREKKWAIHVLFLLLLPSAEAQEKVLECVHCEGLEQALNDLRHDKEWDKWPQNNASLLMQLFNWAELEE